MSYPKVSACLVNWKRPENIPYIISTLRKTQCIDEIIVWNNGAKLDVDATVINSNENRICYGRFLGMNFAKNDIIYTQDDDVIVPTNSIDSLYENFLLKDREIHNYLHQSHFNKSYEANLLLGWGSFFRRDMTAFDKYMSIFGEDELLRVCADLTFAAQKPTNPQLNLGLQHVSASDNHSMHRREYHLRSRKRMMDRLADMPELRPGFRDLRYIDGNVGRNDSQISWHLYFGSRYHNKSILDIGSGLSLSKPRLAIGGNHVSTQDVFPHSPVDIREDTWKIPDKTYDIVTCFDVLEHIPDDKLFLQDLIRIAKEEVVITTPNKLIFNCKNPYHFREYTPNELLNLTTSNVECLASEFTDGNFRHHLTQEKFNDTLLPSLCIIIKV